MKLVLRRLGRSPLFTAMTLITLAVGIGANSSVFSVVNAVLLKPLPYPEAERLVSVFQTAPGMSIPRLNASPSTYFTYREEGRVFHDVALWNRSAVSITGIAEPEEVQALTVTDGLLPLLNVQPALGRWFTRQDDTSGSPLTAMLTHEYWHRRFSGTRDAIGKSIIVDGRPREIVGVMPRHFHFMNLSVSVILPFQFNRSEVFVGNFSYRAIARIKPGVTIAQANADVARMLPMVLDKFPVVTGMNVSVWREARLGPDVRPLKQEVVGDSGKLLWVLMATVGIVFFIACANVANLFLVRADGRQRELAIRAALGAGWLRIARELLTESLALGAAGGVFGFGLAYGALRALVALAPVGLPRLNEIGIDLQSAAFTIAISLVGGVLFGMLPVLKYAGPEIVAGIREGGRGASAGRERHRTRSALVVVQVSLALVLLIGSGLMIRTFLLLKQVKPGFQRPEEILTLRISIPGAQVRDAERVARMQHDIAQKIAALSGVTSVGMSSGITMDGSSSMDPIYASGRTYAESRFPPMRRYKYIGPGSFRTMGNPLAAGRDLTWTDIFEQRPVVVISENLAREYWGDPAAAIGKQLRESPKGVWREIVGVAGNDRHDGVERPAPATVYWPVLLKDLWGQPTSVRRAMAYAIRSPRTGSAGFLHEVQQAVWSVNPNFSLADVRTVQEIYERSMARTSFALTMLGVAAGMALLLGVVGLYGVISYSISQRTREIGIRIALGAQEGEVRRMFVRHGLALTTIGVVCGLGAAAALMRWMSTLLFEVKPIDPITYAAVAAVLLAAAALASYFPARRATVVAPVDALRAE